MAPKIHASITADRVMDIINTAELNLGNPGICLACGEETDGCEPDAREYPCPSCGEKQVYGAEEVLLMIF